MTSWSTRLVIVPLVTIVCRSSAPGVSWYGAPARRSAASTSNSQGSISCADERLAPDLVEQPRQPGDATEHLDRAEVEVVPFAVPGLDQLVHLVAFHPGILARQDS